MNRLAKSWGKVESAHSYDAQGGVIEKRRSGGVFGEDLTITTYNDHGDKASETTTTVTNPDRDREYGITEAGTIDSNRRGSTCSTADGE
jgi:hypothetical protein